MDIDGIVVGLRDAAVALDVDLVSVILFGSQAKQDVDEASDVDLIVVLSDAATDAQLSAVRRHLYKLELSLGFRANASSRLGKMRVVLDRIGAQHKSMFACRYSDFVTPVTPNIFRSESRFDGLILDNPFTANDLGYKNIVLSARTLYGQNLLADLPPIQPIGRHALWQNRITYSLLNLFAVVVFPVSRNATKYSLSAVKWALHSCYFVLTKDPGNLSREVEYFENRYLSPIPRQTLSLRADYRPSFSFVWRAQVFIWRLFTDTLKEARFPVELGLLDAEGEQFHGQG